MRIFTATKAFLFKNKTETALVLLLLVVSAFLRFTQLGYSDFYGDEAKSLYWNKSVSAQEFLLNQRKGPVQFVVAWFVEQVTGGFDSQLLRLPFALAGSLAVPVLYLLLRRRFGIYVALLGTFLFSFNGFYIAFSRIVQYQSFLILFGLLGILFADIYLSNKKKIYVTLSGILLGLSFLSHYDAIFFLVASVVLYWKSLKKQEWFLFFSSILVVTIPFYLPYILGGYFLNHTGGYLGRRFVRGAESPSTFTYMLYNPWLLALLPFVFAPITFKLKDNKMYRAVLVWFLFALFFFEIVVASPGTHIHNYILPLIILSALGVVEFVKGLKQRRFALGVITVLLLGVLIKQTLAFIPQYNSNYPWGDAKIAESKAQKFIYGFPYKRGWDQVESYLREQGVRSFYTTDNVTIGEFYLRGVPSDVHSPHYFVHVYDNQEFYKYWGEIWVDQEPFSGIPQRVDYAKIVLRRDAARYFDLVEEIRVDGEVTAAIYKQAE